MSSCNGSVTEVTLPPLVNRCFVNNTRIEKKQIPGLCAEGREFLAIPVSLVISMIFVFVTVVHGAKRSQATWHGCVCWHTFGPI